MEPDSHNLCEKLKPGFVRLPKRGRAIAMVKKKTLRSSQDPDVIDRFTTTNLQCLVPFHVWHVTGFTLTLVDYVDCTC